MRSQVKDDENVPDVDFVEVDLIHADDILPAPEYGSLIEAQDTGDDDA